MCLAFNYLTAYQLLTRAARVRAGERVLVHGGAGGVGSGALELAAVLKLHAYATASGTGGKVVADLGAVPIDYRREDFVERIRDLTGDGVDVVLDGIGGTVALRSVRTLAPGGRLVMYGHHATLVGGRRDTRKVAIFYATGALAFAANLLPGRRVLAYQSAKTRDRHPDWYRIDLAVLFRLFTDGYLRPLIAARQPRPGTPTSSSPTAGSTANSSSSPNARVRTAP